MLTTGCRVCDELIERNLTLRDLIADLGADVVSQRADPDCETCRPWITTYLKEDGR